MTQNVEVNERPAPDDLLAQIAEYVSNTNIQSEEAYNTAGIV